MSSLGRFLEFAFVLFLRSLGKKVGAQRGRELETGDLEVVGGAVGTVDVDRELLP